MKFISEDKREILFSNVTWTINKNYDIKENISHFIVYNIKKLDDFRNILYSLAYREFRNEIFSIISNNKSNDVALEIIFLTLQEFFSDRIDSSYLGIKSLEKEIISKGYDFYYSKNRKRLINDEIRYAYFSVKKNIVPKVKGKVIEIVEDILKFSSYEKEVYFSELKNLIAKHFDFNLNTFYDSNIQNTEESKRNVKVENKKVIEAEELEIQSAEFSQVDIGKILEQMQKDMADAPIDDILIQNDRMADKIIEMYGKSNFPRNQIEELERKFAIGIHEGERIHITSNFFDVQGHRVEELRANLEQNIDDYEYKKRIYQRNITKLAEEIKRSITDNLDYSMTKSLNGLLMPELAWRKKLLDDKRIFYKKAKDIKGPIIVDLLLDSSGSQTQRQSLVAAEAFVIAEALYQSGIPCRVSSFNNLFDFTILKIYRDYYDPQLKNQNIFMYKAEGSNRDGLAISVTGELLKKREEENKILIILSDGKPNDERPKGAFNIFESFSKAYTGDIAIRDAAREIRKIKFNNIVVLGVFTGNKEDIEDEKRIFGKDFAYINNINKFSDVVGFYLKKHITNIFEN